MSRILRNPVPPNIPLATVTYERLYQDQLNNAFRLYFNQLNNLSSALVGSTGGAYLQFPHGAFHQDGVTTLTAGLTNTSTTPITVTSTAEFLSAGGLLIGSELIKYTGKTATSFTGITRGVYGSTATSHATGDYVSEAQSVPSATTELPISFTITDSSTTVSVDPTDLTKLTFGVSGYYNIQFSAQLLSYDNTVDNVCMWFRQNGVDIANSASYISVPTIHGGNPGASILALNFVLPIIEGDYIQLMLSSTTGNTVCATYPPATLPTRPASPSIILTATFVSSLYT